LVPGSHVPQRNDAYAYVLQTSNGQCSPIRRKGKRAHRLWRAFAKTAGLSADARAEVGWPTTR
jgi:hypothetical protein